MCSIRLLQCALCWFFFFFLEHVVLRSCTASCGTSSIFKSQMAVGFWNAIRTEVSFGVFIINKKNPFFILLSCFKQCVLGLSGLLGLNAVFILPFNCNAIIVWSLEMFVVRQAFISIMCWQKGVQFCAWMYWVPLWWFVKSTLSCPTPFSFAYCYVINQRGRWLWLSRVGCNRVYCIHVPGHDPLILSFRSFSFLIGWGFYDPNYLRC